MRHVNHIEYHRKNATQQRELWQLLDAAADPTVLVAAEAALDEPFVFSQMSLYFNPSGPSEDGFWSVPDWVSYFAWNLDGWTCKDGC